MSYTIMVIDDEQMILDMLRDQFEMEQYQVITAKSSEEALQKLNQQPDIILLDINMPGMDGLELCRAIRDHVACPILFLTARIEEADRVAGLRAGGDDYILKPISKSDIESVLKKIVAIIVERNKKTEYLQLCNDSHVTEDIVLTDGEDMESIIKNYMVENLFSVELSLSKMAGFNSNYLSGVFKQIYGIPFQDYVNRKRMERAKLLLLTTSMKNYEIAEAIGLEDVNYFITKFKKLWGITPKQYRQGIR